MPNRDAPKLFIGMPVYNGERFLERALDSILGQTYGDFRLVISDNASRDGSAAIARRYAARDPRVRFVQQLRTVPAQEHFMFLVAEAGSPYFMWAACDDEWDPRFCELLVAAHEANAALALAFCRYSLVDEQGRQMGAPRTPNYAGASAAERIARLSLQWDDGVFYGMFRRRFMDGLELPIWWAVNRDIPLNVAYPPLCYALAQGDYALVGSDVMWFNRQHATKPYAETLASSAWLDGAAYLLRQANLEVECVKQVFRGTGSVLEAAASAAPIASRIGFDISWRAAYGAFSRARSLARTAARTPMAAGDRC